MKEVLYVYGTLRPNTSFDTVKIPGDLYDLGWFPGAILADKGHPRSIVCQRIEVDDIAAVDAYEGYSSNNEKGSLFIRKPILDGWIYEYNRLFNPVHSFLIEGGDWLEYKRQKKGASYDRYCR